MNDFATPAISGAMDAYLAGFGAGGTAKSGDDGSSVDPLNRLHKATLTLKNLQDIEAYALAQKNAFYTAQKNELDLQDRVMWNSFITPDEERRKTDPTYMTPYDAMVRGIESLPGRIVSTIRTGGAIDSFASEMATLSASLDLMRRATGGSDPMYTALAARMDEASNFLFPQTDPEIVDQVSAALGMGWYGAPGYEDLTDLGAARDNLVYEAGLAIGSSDIKAMSDLAFRARQLYDKDTEARLMAEIAAVSGRLTPEGKRQPSAEEITRDFDLFRTVGDSDAYGRLMTSTAGRAAVSNYGVPGGNVSTVFGANPTTAQAIPSLLNTRQEALLNASIGQYAVSESDERYPISMFELLSWADKGVPPEGEAAAKALRAALRNKGTRTESLARIYKGARDAGLSRVQVSTAVTAFEKGLTLTTKKVTDAEVMSWLGKNIIHTEAQEIWRAANDASADGDTDALAAALQRGRELMQRIN